MVQRAVLLLCTAALDIAAASPGDLPVPAWPGAFNLPLLSSQRSPAIFAPRHTSTGLTLGELVAPFVQGGHCKEPYLTVLGDAGKNATEATRLRLEAVCLLNDADKLLDFMASADEMVSLTLRYEYLGADLSKLGEILEPFPRIEPEWNCSLSTQTTAHLYLSSANASALPEHVDKGDVLVLQVAGSKDWTYAPVSERHATRRDEAHQSRALVREHATLTPGSAMRVPAEVKHSARANSGFSAHITMETMTRPPAGLCPDAPLGSPPVTLEVPASMRSVDHWKDMIAIASNCIITFPGRNCASSEPLPPALPAASPTRASVVSVAAATAALSVGALRASPSEGTTKNGFRAALVSILLGTAGSIDDGSLAERLASTETVVDQLLSMMEALQEQIAGDERAQKEEARVRRKLSGSTETGYLGWDGVNFYIEGGGLAMDQNSLTVSGRDVKTSLEALDGYFARPWNQAVGFHAVKTADKDNMAIGDVVMFDKELLDVGNGYDPATSVYTVPSFGLYRIDIKIMTADKTCDFRLYVNGVDTKLSAWTEELGSSTAGQGSGASLNAMLYLDKDDQVKVVNNLANIDADGSASQYYTHFSGALVGKPHVTTALDHALCFSPACRLSDWVGSLNAELKMGATCTVGDGVYFDGVDDYAVLDDVELGGPMTISLWVKYEAITDDAHLFDFGNGDVSDNIKIKNDQTTNTLQLELTQGIDSAATTKTVEASNFIDTNPFDVTNVLFTTRLTTTTTRLYKDGVLASYIDTGFEPSVLTRSKHVLGKAFGSNHFQGHILSMAIWSRPLSPTEVQQVYSYGADLCSAIGLT